MKSIYREHSKRTGVAWKRRDYDPEDFFDSDPINQALSAANAALYGLVHGVIVSLGCSPGLGFIHSGNERSFVYDIADLYKAETSIPVAFDVVKDNASDIARTTRRRMREEMFLMSIIQRVVNDIYSLLEVESGERIDVKVLTLWDYQRQEVEAGKNYGDSLEWLSGAEEA